MIKKLIYGTVLLMVVCLQQTKAQYVYGTTGLLHAPSADMQRDKTFLCGFSYLQVAATPKHWNYDTWNYYINITLFPWLSRWLRAITVCQPPWRYTESRGAIWPCPCVNKPSYRRLPAYGGSSAPIYRKMDKIQQYILAFMQIDSTLSRYTFYFLPI